MNRKLNLDELMDAVFSDKKEFTELVEALLEISKIYQIPEDEKKKRRSEAKSFLRVAEEDFESAKILYKAGVYSAAIYHLQQSVEKFVKAYVLLLFGLGKKEIRDYVSHDSPKAFLRLLDKFKRILNPTLLIAEKAHLLDTKIPEVSDQDIRKLESLIKKNKEHIAKMSSKEIENLITLGYRLIEILESRKNQEMIKDKLIEILVAFREDLGEIETSKKDQNEVDESIAFIDQTIEKIRNTDVILGDYSKMPALYILSLITYPHATSARYPSEALSPDEYDENLGIVQCFDKIAMLLNEVVSSWKVSLEQDKILDQEEIIEKEEV